MNAQFSFLVSHTKKWYQYAKLSWFSWNSCSTLTFWFFQLILLFVTTFNFLFCLKLPENRRKWILSYWSINNYWIIINKLCLSLAKYLTSIAWKCEIQLNWNPIYIWIALFTIVSYDLFHLWRASLNLMQKSNIYLEMK